MPRRRRVGNYINVRLAAGRDADLIQWWESVPDGEGAELVKRAIREYLRSAGEVERAATVGDLERMAVWLVEQLKHLTPSPSPNSERGAADGEQLTNEEVAARERKVRERRW